MQAALDGLDSVSYNGARVTRSVLTSGFSWTIMFTSTSRFSIGDLPLLTVDASSLDGGDVKATVHKQVAGNSLSKDTIDTLLTLKGCENRNWDPTRCEDADLSFGTSYSGVWLSARVLTIQLDNTVGMSPTRFTRIGGLFLAVNQSAGLKSADESSLASTAPRF